MDSPKCGLFQVTIWFGDRSEHCYCDWTTELKMVLHLYDESRSADQIRIRKWNGNDYVDLEGEEYSINALRRLETSFDNEATFAA